ncbi:MAG: Do family serine endopeptidase [Hyphomicrobiales bacterium]|nr:Do family serine endopeptidase [Hyphomicrobiales bacterium]
MVLSNAMRNIGIGNIGSALMVPLLAMVITVSPIPGGMTPAVAQDINGPTSVADLAEKLLDTVVNISTSQKVAQRRPNVPLPKVPEGSPFQDFFDELLPNRPKDKNKRPRSRSSLGSGFVIDASGIVVTNNHVIANADEITVNFADGTKLEAEVIGRDPKVDIAILRVKPETPLKAVTFGDSNGSRIGDWVMAIGNPLGLSGTVTLGIVSAINRNINSGPYDSFIQTDAAINRGNSGGPLFNMAGEVIGINTAIISPSGGSIGLGFSIPSSLAKRVVDQLVKFGETRRGWLGVQIQTVTEEIAETLGLDEARGALVGEVVPNGPAAKAEIKSGDVILSFDGKEVERMRDLPRIVADTPVEKEVVVVVLRKGKEITLGVSVGRLEDGEKQIASSNGKKKDDTEKKAKSSLGMSLGKITDELRKSEEIKDSVTGVFILKVEEGSNAQDKNIKAGEIIVEVGQEAVSSAKDVIRRVEELKTQGRKNALLMISTKTGDIRFVVVRIDS